MDKLLNDNIEEVEDSVLLLSNAREAKDVVENEEIKH